MELESYLWGAATLLRGYIDAGDYKQFIFPLLFYKRLCEEWTNKDRQPDRMLRELIEHFSSQTLSLSNCPEDELGVGYEFLVKKFADDSGHTAAEFYTNRTVVHPMTEMLEPKPGESIHAPTCRSAGMLLSAVAHLKRQNKECRKMVLFINAVNEVTRKRAQSFLADDHIQRGVAETVSLKQAMANWQDSSMALRESMKNLLAMVESQGDGR